MSRHALFVACTLACAPLFAQDSGFTPEQEAWLARTIEAAVRNQQSHQTDPVLAGSPATGNVESVVATTPPPKQGEGPREDRPVLIDPVKNEEGWRAGSTPEAWGGAKMKFIPGDLPTTENLAVPKRAGGDASVKTSINMIALSQRMYTDAVAYAPAGRAAIGAPALKESPINRAQFDVTFDKDNSVAALALSRVQPLLEQEKTMTTRSWTLTLSAPINGDSGDARFITTNGLSQAFGAKLESRWQRQNIEFVSDPAFADALYELCSGGGMKASCSLGGLEEKARDKARDDGGELLRRFRKFTRDYVPWIWDLGVNIEGRRVRSDYLTPQLARDTLRDEQWGVGVDVVAITPSRRNAFALGASYGHDLKPGDVAILCPPSNGVDPVECVSGPLGAPAESAGFKVSAEARGQFLRLGYSLRLEHNLATDRDIVDLPIYFLRNAEGALMGGLRFGWSSDLGSDVAVFVSAPFTFLK